MIHIIASFCRWYFHQVCRVPRDLFFFALGATYVSVLDAPHNPPMSS
jgi:hypothetical protein